MIVYALTKINTEKLSSSSNNFSGRASYGIIELSHLLVRAPRNLLFSFQPIAENGQQ